MQEIEMADSLSASQSPAPAAGARMTLDIAAWLGNAA
jgi:hypothetical protein